MRNFTSQAVEKAKENPEDGDVFQDPQMADNPTEASTSDSSLYREFLAERDEILRQKWLKSEEANQDIGLERALVEWASESRTDWKKKFFNKLKNKSTS